MPAVPMHAASFQGSVARFEVQTQSSKQQPNRFRITCHSNMYIGQIRRLIASKLQAQAEHVRLFAHGEPPAPSMPFPPSREVRSGYVRKACDTLAGDVCSIKFQSFVSLSQI